MATLLSPAFGNGSDGVLTISNDTTDAPIDSSCSGTAGATSLTATNASFASGQLILIHQSRGTGVGQWELNKIASYVAGTITTAIPLVYTYTDSGASQAQVLVVKQYSGITINNTKTLTAKAWNSNVGGIIAFACNGKLTVTGTITALGKGFAGGIARNFGTVSVDPQQYGYTGEGTTGASDIGVSANPIGNGAGAGRVGNWVTGAGGGNGTSGTVGIEYNGVTGSGGGTSGQADLQNMTFGGGGGGGTKDSSGASNGGAGGGIILLFTKEIVVTGSITANGGNGIDATNAGGGGGGGGSILIKTQSATLGTGLVTASGGTGAQGDSNGGNGGVGRNRIEYQSLTGTTTPTASTASVYFGSDHAGMI